MVSLIGARFEGGHRVRLKFGDGLEGVVDLSSELHGEVFEPLRDGALFAQVRLDPDTHTLTWPNAADLAPEYLYELLRVVADPGKPACNRPAPRADERRRR